MKKHWIWLLGLAVIASWSWNLSLYKQQELEKPIFLKHYYEIPVSLSEHLSLYYIKNVDNEQQPYQFGLPDGMMLRVENDTVRDERGRLQLREATVSPFDMDELRKQDEQLDYDQLEVFYNDGTIEMVSIGQIIVHPDSTRGSSLDQQFGKGSNDGTGSASYVVSKQAVVAALTHSFPDLLSDVIEMNLNGASGTDDNAFPMELSKGDTATFEYRFFIPDDDVRRYHAYYISYDYKDQQGGNVGSSIQITQPQLYAEDLAAYVRLRKEEAGNE